MQKSRQIYARVRVTNNVKEILNPRRNGNANVKIARLVA